MKFDDGEFWFQTLTGTKHSRTTSWNAFVEKIATSRNSKVYWFENAAVENAAVKNGWHVS